MSAERSESESWSVTRNASTPCSKVSSLTARVQSVPHMPVQAERVEYLAQRLPDVRVREWLMGQGTGSGNLDGHIVSCHKRNHVGQIGERFWRRWRLEGLNQTHMIDHLGVWMAAGQFT